MSVCDGSSVFEEHAEPVETEMPSSFIDSSSDSPSMPSKRKCALFGSALGRVPVEMRVRDRREHGAR